MNAPFDRKTATPRADHQGDLHAWAREQAALLRAGRITEADAAYIAAELDDVAAAQYEKLESALRVLLTHMLKWDHQPERGGGAGATRSPPTGSTRQRCCGRIPA